MRFNGFPRHLPWSLAFQLLFLTSTGHAWTEARLTRVDHALKVNADQRTADLETRVRFEVTGGELHGFDLAALPGAVRSADGCFAEKDDGTRLALKTTESGGMTSVLLAGPGVSRGGVTFVLGYRVDLAAAGALVARPDGEWLAWPAPVWDQGMDAMSLTLSLGPGLEPAYDVSAKEDLTIDRDGAGATRFVKYRPSRGYAMTVPIRLSGQPLAAASERPAAPAAIVKAAPADAAKPDRTAIPLFLVPLLGCVMGLQVILRKWRWIHAMHAVSRASVEQALLPSLGFGPRLAVSVVLVLSAVFAQVLFSAAAGVIPIALVPALWMTAPAMNLDLSLQGGVWRPLGEAERTALRLDLRRYRRRRLSLLDASHIAGKIAFGLATAGVAGLAYLVNDFSARTAFIFGLDALLLLVPVWFCGSRDELPPDPLLAGFEALERFSGRLERLVRRSFPGTTDGMWARYVEGRDRPVEVRLRLDPTPADLHGVEVAAEMVRSGNRILASSAVILRVPPNTPIAHDLASSPLASETVLTPDLGEEIVVIRARRSRDHWLVPIRSAFRIVTAAGEGSTPIPS